MKFHLISTVIATYNSERTLGKCLYSLSQQLYPKTKIELIISDGGSSDSTLKIAKKYDAQIVYPPKKIQSAEYNKGFGLSFARGKFILCIDHDNVLPHKNWLPKMLKPLLEDKSVVASEPLRYRYDSSLSWLDRYFALFGVNDPLPYYLGKADRMDYIHDKYNLIGDATDKGDYYLVKFDKKNPSHIPTLGANGFLIRRSYFIRSDHKPGRYFHIDINVDLVKLGYVHYAFIKDDIIHLTNSKLINFFKRRRQFMEQYHLQNLSNRRYSVYYTGDTGKLILFIIYSLTFIKPFFDSLRGFLRIRDYAWFVHPFMCFAVLVVYTGSVIKNHVKRLFFQINLI